MIAFLPELFILDYLIEMKKNPLVFLSIKNNSLEILTQNFPVANGPSLYKDHNLLE